MRKKPGNSADPGSSDADEFASPSETRHQTSENGPKPRRPKQQRRWLQYSLRGLLALMLLAAAGSWWLANELLPARREEQAIARLKEESNYLFDLGYAHQRRQDGSFDLLMEAQGNETLRSWLGDAYFDDPQFLGFHGKSLSDGAAAGLRDLPTLEALIVATGDEGISLAAAKSIASLSRLDWLEMLTNGDMSSESLAALAPLAELENFIYVGKGTFAADDVGRFVSDKTRLSFLQLNDCTLESGALGKIAQLPKLQQLNLSGAQFDRSELESLATSPIQRLNLGENGITDRNMRDIGRISTLSALLMREGQITDAGLRELAGLSKLNLLLIRDVPLSGEGFAALQQLHALFKVSISTAPMTDAGFQALAKVHAIEDLALFKVEITGAGLTALAELPNLRELTLSGTTLTAADLTVLTEFPSLEALDLTGTTLTDEAMPYVAKLKLRRLSLPNSMTAGIVPQLLQMTTLDRLELPRTFPPQPTTSVKAGLPNCRTSGGSRVLTQAAKTNAPPERD